MNKKKIYVVILIILLIFTLLMYLLVGRGELKRKQTATTIIVGDYSIWNYSDGSWLNITSDSTKETISWLDYTVYIDNKKIGNYYLWYNDNKWYAFDKNKKAVVTEGNLLAYRSNHAIKVKDFEVTPIRNYYNVEKILKENNLSISNFTVETEVNFDIDNDGNNETLYFVSNAFPIDFNPSKIFSLVFMLKDGKIETLYRDVDENRYENGCKPYLKGIMDVDNDNVYELIISCGKYSVEKPIDMLYKLTDDGFKILISNQ